jgi:tRNA-Thr(GGU) m(6)t(6)A37 methyltransferase TsaA
MSDFRLHPIATARTPFTVTGEIPKGLGAKHEAEGTIEVLPELEPGLTDIEGFSHLYVIWLFDRVEQVELLAHPPNSDRTHGVFATRSPMRPNRLGLTVVELLGRAGANLHVRGVDMLDGTPVLDLKPYLSNVDPAKLRRGWLAEVEARASGAG